MSEIHDIELAGCTPEPLMNYLKALGVLRLVSEQKDPEATGYWRNERFHLRSRLDREALQNFFLNEYEPTPILAPWNAGCGLYKKWDVANRRFKKREAVKALEYIENSSHERFKRYRDEIRRVRLVLEKEGEVFDIAEEIEALDRELSKQGVSDREKKKRIGQFLDSLLIFEVDGKPVRLAKSQKDKFLARLRSSYLSDSALQWLDSAVVLRPSEFSQKDRKATEAPLLGTGGNIGNSELSARFMQLLGEILPVKQGDSTSQQSQEYLKAALFGSVIPGLRSVKVDQFAPGQAGGANMAQGFEGDSKLNPWDYVLMIEGALFFAGTTTRSLGAQRSSAAFPFTVQPAALGFGSAGDEECRAELWLPLWERPVTGSELAVLLREGRSNVGTREAKDGLDFARAVAGLGVDRGIESFVRLQFQKRFGDNFLATPVGRLTVRARRGVQLIHELDWWIVRYRTGLRAAKDPVRLRNALRVVESSIFDYCRYGRREDLEQVLRTLGRAERELALTAGKVGKKEVAPPCPMLRSEWVAETHDGSAEFQIALAISSIYNSAIFETGNRDRGVQGERTGRTVDVIRTDLEPLERRGQRCNWRGGDSPPPVRWRSTELAGNLSAVLERRLLAEASPDGRDSPLQSRYGVSLPIVAAWLKGVLDDRRIEELIWGLALVNHMKSRVRGLPRASIDPACRVPLPRAYALLKLLFLPHPLHGPKSAQDRWRFTEHGEEGIRIRPELSILPLLRANRTPDACQLAYRRLWASGLAPLPGVRPRGRPSASWWSQAELSVSGVEGVRLAGALLIPLQAEETDALARLVLRSPKDLDSESVIEEGVSVS